MSFIPTNQTAVGGAPSGAGAAGIEVDSEMLMFHINVVCLILLGVLTLVRLPHALGLFSSKEWLGSQFLRRVSPRPAVRRFTGQDIYFPASTFKGK